MIYVIFLIARMLTVLVVVLFQIGARMKAIAVTVTLQMRINPPMMRGSVYYRRADICL